LKKGNENGHEQAVGLTPWTWRW